MAGLFDDFGVAPINDPEQVRKALEAQQREQLSTISAGAETKKGRAAGRIVEGLAGIAGLGAFGEDLKEKFSVADDPQLAAAKQQALIAKTINELPGDPSSAAFASAASQVALDNGRPDLALKFRTAAGTRGKAEAASVASQKLAASKEARAQFDALPNSAQEELVARRPQFLVETLGISDEEAAGISTGVAERNEFQRAKLQKQMDEVTKATSIKTTSADVDQIKSTLSLFGIDNSSFGFGDNEEEFNAFATPIAAEVQRRTDVLKDKGQRADRNKIANDVMEELTTAGAFTLEDQFFGDSKNITDVDPDRFRNVFTVDKDVIDLSQ